MFTDRVQIKFLAGNGGNGVVAWRREKYIPKGGPAGGNGGRGGSVYLIADPQIPSLEDYRYARTLKAERGGDGGGGGLTGRSGKDLQLKVPCGTLVKDLKTDEVICDLTEPGQRFCICEGGKGGRGNRSFKTATNRAPNKCTQGTPGQSREIELELKLIADVGFVGFPNAGKSTLISAITSSRVKIAPYPFTTLSPNLGYIQFDDYSRILIADIPGIIRGASEDRGLGLEFLRHIERTKVLVFVIDASGIDGRDPREDLQTLRQELLAYDPQLATRPHVLVLNKCDDPDSQLWLEEFRKDMDGFFELSALQKEGLEPFVDKIRDLAQADGKRFY